MKCNSDKLFNACYNFVEITHYLKSNFLIEKHQQYWKVGDNLYVPLH